MKLITKFIWIYLTVTLIVLGIGGFLSFHIITDEINNELKWEFLDRIDRVTYLIERGRRFHPKRSIEGDRNLNTKFRGRIGNREFMNAHAGGKAILSEYDNNRVMNIIEKHGLPAYTQQSITDTEELLTELERVREEGVAFNDEEAIEGYRAVGAPVSLNDETIGSITIGGPKNRMTDGYYKDTLPDLIRGVINEIELRGSVSSPWE